MSEFRELRAKLEKIEESYYSRLAAAIDDLVTANPEVDPVTLVRLARSQLGDDAAKYLSDKLESEGDFLDYDSRAKAADKPIRRHMKKLGEADSNLFVNDDIHGQIKAELDRVDPRLKIGAYGPGDSANLISVLAYGEGFDIDDPFDSGERDMVFNLNTGKFLDYDDAGKEHMIGMDDWLGQNPFESIEEGWPQREETYNEMVDYWKKSLSSSIVSKGLFTQMYDAANKNIEELNAAIEEEAWSIADSYHGTGEGIGSSDQNHFIVSIARQLGIEDIFGWNKPRIEEAELDEARGRVVEVPPELRGESNEIGGATSRDAERFLADLGPDDDVSHDVVDPETGELLDWPTGGLNRNEREDDADMAAAAWRLRGGTKRELGQRQYKADQDQRTGYDNVPHLYIDNAEEEYGYEFGGGAAQLLNELRESDFYNVVWRDLSDDVEDPEMMRDNDYDIDVEIPVLLKRKDGKKLTDDDHDNIKVIITAVKQASTLGNIGIGYAGTTDEGTTARFHATFH